jgi:hypothetical protein
MPKLFADSMFFLIPLSVFFYFYMGYEFGNMYSQRFNYTNSTALSVFSPMVPIMGAPYLIFFSNKLNVRQNILVHLASILLLFFGIITLTRSTVLLAIVPYVLNLVHLIVFKQKFTTLVKGILIILVCYYGIFQTRIVQQSGFFDSIEGILYRTEIQELGNEGSREDELGLYMKQNLDFFEIVFGRGMGGHKVRKDSDYYDGGINMLHFGPAMVFMKGGILLVFIIYAPIIWIIVYYLMTSYYQISLLLIYFLSVNFFNTTWNYLYISTFFYWYSVFFFLKKRKNTNDLVY